MKEKNKSKITKEKKDKDFVLELYKIFNNKVNEETNEHYTLNGAFWLITAALFAGFILNFDRVPFKIGITIIGFLISFWWYKALRGQAYWKNFWTYKLMDIEQLLEENNPYIKERFGKLEKIRKIHKRWDWLKELEKSGNYGFKKEGIWRELDSEKAGFGVAKYFRWTALLLVFAWIALFLISICSIINLYNFLLSIWHVFF